MQLLLDVHIAPPSPARFNRMTVDALHVRDWPDGLYRDASGEAILTAALVHRRTLVTYDCRTIPTLLKEWAETRTETRPGSSWWTSVRCDRPRSADWCAPCARWSNSMATTCGSTGWCICARRRNERHAPYLLVHGVLAGDDQARRRRGPSRSTRAGPIKNRCSASPLSSPIANFNPSGRLDGETKPSISPATIRIGSRPDQEQRGSWPACTSASRRAAGPGGSSTRPSASQPHRR